MGSAAVRSGYKGDGGSALRFRAVASAAGHPLFPGATFELMTEPGSARRGGTGLAPRRSQLGMGVLRVLVAGTVEWTRRADGTYDLSARGLRPALLAPVARLPRLSGFIPLSEPVHLLLEVPARAGQGPRLTVVPVAAGHLEAADGTRFAVLVKEGRPRKARGTRAAPRGATRRSKTGNSPNASGFEGPPEESFAADAEMRGEGISGVLARDTLFEATPPPDLSSPPGEQPVERPLEGKTA